MVVGQRQQHVPFRANTMPLAKPREMRRVASLCAIVWTEHARTQHCAVQFRLSLKYLAPSASRRRYVDMKADCVHQTHMDNEGDNVL